MRSCEGIPRWDLRNWPLETVWSFEGDAGGILFAGIIRSFAAEEFDSGGG